MTAPGKIPPILPSTAPGIIVTGSKLRTFTPSRDGSHAAFKVGDRVRERQCWAYGHNGDNPERWPEDSTRRGEVVNTGSASATTVPGRKLIPAVWVLWDDDDVPGRKNDQPEQETDLSNLQVLSPIDEIARLDNGEG